MKPSTVRWMLAVTVAVLVVLPAVAPGQSDPAATGLAPTDAPSTGSSSSPTADEQAARRELEELADAWALGGGTFGYPFWEKAGRRWAAGQITTTMYREYVTGYRDRMRGGCRLLDAIDVDEDVSRDVRGLVEDACSARLDALREQQQWLDALVDADVPARADGDAAAATERAAELQAEAAEHEAGYREAIQESYRSARLAMEAAQAWLDETGQERLPEDAFV